MQSSCSNESDGNTSSYSDILESLMQASSVQNPCNCKELVNELVYSLERLREQRERRCAVPASHEPETVKFQSHTLRGDRCQNCSKEHANAQSVQACLSCRDGKALKLSTSLDPNNSGVLWHENILSVDSHVATSSKGTGEFVKDIKLTLIAICYALLMCGKLWC